MTDFKFPLISVLVPVYNAEPFLVMCLDSIFAQTYPNFEVVCIDDASADKSADILEQYARKHPRMKLLKLPAHQSVAVVRNLLLQEAAGEYIAFIDADDSVHPEYLAHLYQAAQNTGADVVRCLYQLQDIRKNTLVPCEKKYKEFQELDPTTPQSIKDRRMQELQENQQKIQNFQQMAAQDLQKQQETLLAPITDKIQKAIQAVGAEGGYTFIYDLSIPAVVYSGAGAEDVTPQVKAKLGIK